MKDGTLKDQLMIISLFSLMEQTMVSNFTEQQRRILDMICRLSLGCDKEEAYIPRQRDFEIVGVGEGHGKRQLDWLIEAKVITRDDCFYEINRDYDEWRVSRSLTFVPEQLDELIEINEKEKEEILKKYSREKEDADSPLRSGLLRRFLVKKDDTDEDEDHIPELPEGLKRYLER